MMETKKIVCILIVLGLFMVSHILLNIPLSEDTNLKDYDYGYI